MKQKLNRDQPLRMAVKRIGRRNSLPYGEIISSVNGEILPTALTSPL